MGYNFKQYNIRQKQFNLVAESCIIESLQIPKEWETAQTLERFWKSSLQNLKQSITWKPALPIQFIVIF